MNHEDAKTRRGYQPESRSIECPKCEGCGRIGSDEDQTPWSVWESLPPGSDLAVRSGLVKPITCPECEGTGKVPAPLPEPPSGRSGESSVKTPRPTPSVIGRAQEPVEADPNPDHAEIAFEAMKILLHNASADGFKMLDTVDLEGKRIDEWIACVSNDLADCMIAERRRRRGEGDEKATR